jgi:dihydrofolate reductase
MAQTLDGIISRSSDEFIDWTGNADKKMFVQVTKRAGVVIMGSKTYDTIGRPLPGRRNVVLTRNSRRTSNHDHLVFSDKDPQTLLADLEGDGFQEVAIIGGAQVNSLFAGHNLLDEIIITIAPKVFGKGLTLFNIPLDLNLKLLSSEILETNYIMLHYAVVRRTGLSQQVE